ncbi:hypothetical protein TNCV_612851 [Trichonephila clavipes]|nr:hypothetical protein TNCV_612851 [Trichonephila clavipes]
MKKNFELIKHCFLTRKNTVKAKQWLDNCYPDSTPPLTMIKRWYAAFKCGHKDTNNDEASGRPNSAVSENIKRVHKIILANRKLKLREVAKDSRISKSSVFTILHDHLSMRKQWVLRLLTVDQKQQSNDYSQHYLELFKLKKWDFLRRYVTMDKIWIHYYMPE